MMAERSAKACFSVLIIMVTINYCCSGNQPRDTEEERGLLRLQE
jgi:hypothetical protein